MANGFYYVKPAKGFITSLFSNARKNPVLGVIRPHQGIDISSDADNTIIAAASGRVRVADTAGRTSFGRYVVITHGNGQETVYAHLSTVSVRVGQSVKQGAKIGVKGTTGNSTGVHLHFEISRGRWTNSFANKIDPLTQLYDPVTRDIQAHLQRLGYVVTVDGIYGDGTIAAVTRYQRAKGLTADGVAGRATYAALERDIKALGPAGNTQDTSSKEAGKRMFNPTSGTLKNSVVKYLEDAAKDKLVLAKWGADAKAGKLTLDDAFALYVEIESRRKIAQK
ncbi:peptidoglycan DD-metalloendopeptidase family protein [Sporosarcina koreensis]|uniref:peptidoglycan DD-metalloendopeptidase family protein n=1 Tax=Sporosarcina koreensis TaxID=334735 RepID=UPI000753737F|nr:peptidoglycan DD-metalloendopeptidase family protein [Sporosarcina koreensis]